MKLQPGLYTALIIRRSTSNPSRNIQYDIAIRIGRKEVIFENITPQKETRWTTIDSEIELIPFPLGTRVPVHIFEEQGNLVGVIGISELPYINEC